MKCEGPKSALTMLTPTVLEKSERCDLLWPMLVCPYFGAVLYWQTGGQKGEEKKDIKKDEGKRKGTKVKQKGERFLAKGM